MEDKGSHHRNDLQSVATCLESMGNPVRLNIFRLLVQAGNGGMPASNIQRAIDIPASTLSHHLSHLHGAHLVTQERRSRQLIYRANYATMNRIIDYLNENCCGADSLGDSSL